MKIIKNISRKTLNTDVYNLSVQQMLAMIIITFIFKTMNNGNLLNTILIYWFPELSILNTRIKGF